MTQTEFSAWCSRGVHFLDGATGSMLRAAGMPAGVCSETWILEHPQTLIGLQQAYLAAGSEIIYAPSFGANRVLLGHHDLQKEVRSLNRELVQLGREAVGVPPRRRTVEGDLGVYASVEDLKALFRKIMYNVTRQEAARPP